MTRGKKVKAKGKKWPVDGEPADYEALADPFRELFLRLYPDFDPKIAVPVDRWDGLPLNFREGATCCEPPGYLSRNGLDRQAEQGRDALDNFIGCVLRVGMEQGRRMLFDRTTRVLLGIAAGRLRESDGANAHLADVLDGFSNYGKGP